MSRRVCGAIARLKFPSRIAPSLSQDHALQAVLVRRGRGTYVARGKVFEVEATAILWLPVSAEVDVASATRSLSEDYSAWCVSFGGQLIERASRDANAQVLASALGEGGLVQRLGKLSARRLEAQLDQLAAVGAQGERFAEGLEAFLLLAWAEHRKAARISALTNVHPAVEKAAHILRTQPETGSMQELAHVCGASPSWLSRLFRQQVGISLVGYRNESRIERFFELYGEGHRRNLTQAAYEAGFGSYAQFHRVFKEALGYSPGELKRHLHDPQGG